MTPDTVNELIWHFSGYLQLPPDDLSTIKIFYDGGEPYAVGHDSDPAPGHAPWVFGPEVSIGSMPEVPVLPAPITHLHMSRPVSHPWAPHFQMHFPHMAHHADAPIAIDTDVSGGGSEQFHISAIYQPGGDQLLMDLQQVNALISNNQVNAPADVVAMNDLHATDVLNSMMDNAPDQAPSDFQPQATDTSGLEAFVDSNAAQPLALQASAAPYAVDPGQYVNGTPVTDGSDPHQITNDLFNTVSNALNQGFDGPPAPPSGDYASDSIQNVSVGSNIAANDAAISNLEAASVSLAVQGNYYETQSVVQTNVFEESDHISGAGVGLGSTSVTPNAIDNIADIQNQVPTLTSDGSGVTPSGLTWSVDVLNGSLQDVQSLVQTNYIENNNVVYQTSYSGDSEIVAGGNTQVNVGESNLAANYDLVIVEGNYYQDDLINQTNVVLDSNNIALNGGGASAAGAGGGPTGGDPVSQSATTGGNSVVNDATIIDTGNHSYQPLTTDAQTVLQALESNSSSVDPSAALSAFPQLFGNISVLVVTGDYYDVNYISQTNIMSNSNVVSLTGSASAPTGATQSVNTGNDIAVNAATIVDGGSVTSPYLQGHYYSDSILLQTNIIGDESKITTQDPNQLAPELVAFTSPMNETVGQGSSISSAVDPHQHHDGVASMLH